MKLFKMYLSWFSTEEMKGWSSIRRTAYLLLPLLIYFLAHDVSEIILWALVNQILVHGGDAVIQKVQTYAYTIRGMVNGLAILLGVAFVWKILTSETANSFVTDGKKVSDSKLKSTIEAADKKSNKLSHNVVTDYMMLGTLAFSSAVGLNLFLSLIGFTGSSRSYESTAASQYGVAFLIGIVLYGIISPIAEEAIFRGIIYNRMKRCFPGWIALIFSSLLFGCYHMNWVQGVYGFLLGLLIAYTYELFKSFAAPVIYHAIANISVYVITYNNNMGKLDTAAAIMTCVLLLITALVSFLAIRKRLGIKATEE